VTVNITVIWCLLLNACKLINIEICALLGYYAAYSGNSLLTFRDNLSVPSSWVKKSKKRPGHTLVLGL